MSEPLPNKDIKIKNETENLPRKDPKSMTTEELDEIINKEKVLSNKLIQDSNTNTNKVVQLYPIGRSSSAKEENIPVINTLNSVENIHCNTTPDNLNKTEKVLEFDHKQQNKEEISNSEIKKDNLAKSFMNSELNKDANFNPTHSISIPNQNNYNPTQSMSMPNQNILDDCKQVLNHTSLGLNFTYSGKIDKAKMGLEIPTRISVNNTFENNNIFKISLLKPEIKSHDLLNKDNLCNFSDFSEHEEKSKTISQNINQTINKNFMSPNPYSNTTNHSELLNSERKALSQIDNYNYKYHPPKYLNQNSPDKHLSNTVANLQDRIASLLQDNEELRHNTLKSKSNNDLDIHLLNEKMGILHDRIQFLTNENREFQNITSEIRFIEAENRDLKNRIFDLNTDKDNITQSKNAEILFNQNQMEDLKRNYLELTKINENLINSTKQESDYYLKQIDDLQKNLNEMTRANDDLRGRKHEADYYYKQLEELKQKNSELGMENTELKKQKHELEYYLSQSDEAKDKAVLTNNNNLIERDEYQKKYLNEAKRADEFQRELESQSRSHDIEKIELIKTIKELNRQIEILETSVRMLEDEKLRFVKFSNEEKEKSKKQQENLNDENDSLKNKVRMNENEILRLHNSLKICDEDKEILQDTIELLKSDILDINKANNQKCEENNLQVKEKQNKLKTEINELKNKIKSLQNKLRFNEIEKNDEIKKYENLVSTLTERMYKIEGKKYHFNMKHINVMRSNDKAKTFSNEILGQLSKVSPNKSRSAYHNLSPEIEKKTHGFQNYFKEKSDRIADKINNSYDRSKTSKDKMAYSAKRITSNKKLNASQSSLGVKDYIGDYEGGSEEDSEKKSYKITSKPNEVRYATLQPNNFKNGTPSREKDPLDSKIEAFERLITELNKEYNKLMIKINVAQNEAEIRVLKDRIERKSDEIERESKKLTQLKREKSDSLKRDR